MTAKQQTEQFYSWLEDKVDSKGDLEDMLIRFAQFHVKAALEAAAEAATFDFENNPSMDTHGVDISTKSILNAYPLENIK